MTDTAPVTRPATQAETDAVLSALAQRVRVARAAHADALAERDLQLIDKLLDRYGGRG